MTWIDNASGDLAVDLVIDDVVARRAAGKIAGEPPRTLLSRDEALVADLAALGEIEWPAPEVGDRVTMTVLAAARQRAVPAPGPAALEARHRRRQAGTRALRSARSRGLALGAATAAAAVVVAAVQLAGPHGAGKPVAGPSTAGRKSQQPAPPVTPSPAVTPEAAGAMTIVASSAQLHLIGQLNSGNGFLTCPTRRVCYVEADLGNGADIARTTDGGVTWTQGAQLPRSNFEWNPHPSCPRPLTCFTAFGKGLLETTDGYAHLHVQPVQLPAGMSSWQVQDVSCPTTRYCVADVVLTSNNQAFVYSHDGGRTWALGSAPVLSWATHTVTELQCDRSGACIAPFWGGTATAGTAGALVSPDGGRSWTFADYPTPYLNEFTISCPDARDCLIGGSAGSNHLVWLHVTPGGQISSWIQAFPSNWGRTTTGTTLACATARVCWVEVQDPAGYNWMYKTSNGGLGWKRLGKTVVPTAPDFYAQWLSCPAPAGCIALGNDQGSYDRTWAVMSSIP